MIPIDVGNVRDLLTALTIIALLMLSPTLAHGQLAVTDPPVETATAQTAAEVNQVIQALQQDVNVNTQTMQSVTTKGGAGYFQSNASYLDSLDGNFNKATINSTQAFTTMFPGWQALPADAVQAASSVAAVGLATYQAALGAARQQAAGFDAEDSHLTAIENANQAAASVLQAIQLNTEAQLAVAQQIQLERQLQVSEIILEATKAGEELNERAQTGATSAQAANLGTPPQ